MLEVLWFFVLEEGRPRCVGAGRFLSFADHEGVYRLPGGCFKQLGSQRCLLPISVLDGDGDFHGGVLGDVAGLVRTLDDSVDLLQLVCLAAGDTSLVYDREQDVVFEVLGIVIFLVYDFG